MTYTRPMFKHLKLFTLYCALFTTLFMQTSKADEQLVIVDAVSSSRQTFVIQRGAADGIARGAESLFSNENVSVLAQAIEVTRQHSLWRLKEQSATFPFKKNQSIVFNKNRTDIWSELPNIQKRISKAKREEEVFAQLYGDGRTIQLRGSFSNTFYESTTDTDSQQSPDRTGIHIEGIYHWRLWEKFEIGAGLRFDSEDAVISDPDLTIPNTRIMAIAELTYHFSDFQGQGNNFFMAAGLGIGRSQTQVDQAVSTGLATVLPSLRVGYIIRRAGGFDFTFETVAEAISATESFIDTKEQTTNLVNAKVALGIRF